MNVFIIRTNNRQGYETLVGNSGITLSGGQRQRLAIARSIVKRPSILILDEATSSIDIRSEQIVQAALNKVSRGRTTIAIAHRLSTIKSADLIIVLQKGNVVEQGTHARLMAYEGAYWDLVHAQQMSLGDDDSDDEASTVDPDSMTFLGQSTSTSERGLVPTDPRPTPLVSQKAAYKPKGLVRSFGFLLSEQKRFWPWYILLLAGALGAGCESIYPASTQP
jgi:ABC-type multidrug transport system ATPase subunit